MDYKAQLAAWEQRRQKIVALFKAGKSRTEIARLMKVSRQRVYQLTEGRKA